MRPLVLRYDIALVKLKLVILMVAAAIINLASVLMGTKC